MPDNLSGNDPKKMWQSQPREVSAAMLERMIRRRAQKLHTRTLWDRLGSVAGPVGVVAFSAFGISQGFNPIAFAIAVVWSLIGLYVLNRGAWPARLAADAAFTTGLEFCRKEIERRIYVHRRFLLWAFAPIVLAIGAFAVQAVQAAVREHLQLANMIPFFALLALWVIGVFVIRSWRWKAMQREIDELDDLEREVR